MGMVGDSKVFFLFRFWVLSRQPEFPESGTDRLTEAAQSDRRRTISIRRRESTTNKIFLGINSLKCSNFGLFQCFFEHDNI